MAAFAATCRRHHDLANPILYKINIDRDLSTAMLWAARYGRIGTLERMLMYGAEVNDAVASIDFEGDIPTWIIGDPIIRDTQLDDHPLPRDGRGRCIFAPLALAAAYGQDIAVRWLLDHGARLGMPAQNLCLCHCIIPDGDELVDGNRYHPGLIPLWTPLHLAVCNGHISTTKLLINRGADPRNTCKGNNDDFYYYRCHSTALHAAAWATNNAGALVEYLVTRQNIPINVRDSSWDSALHHACVNFQDQSALKRLIELGADLEAEEATYNGTTPLGLAIFRGNFRAALCLLENGANHDIIIKAEDRATTPLAMAIRSYSFFFHTCSYTEIGFNKWEGEQKALIRKLQELEAS